MLHCQLRLDRVDAAVPQIFGKFYMQLDALQRTCHEFGAAEQAVQVDHPTVEPLLARKRQQLLGQGLSFFRRGPGTAGTVDDALRIATGALGALLDQVEITHHHLQQVIEVMSNATGQLPQRFQVLCATHALLSVVTPAHVQLRGEKIHQLPTFVEQRRNEQLVPEGRAILAVVEHLDTGLMVLLNRALHLVQRVFVGLRPLQEPAITSDHFVQFKACQGQERLVGKDDRIIRPRGVGHDHCTVAGLHGRKEQVFAAGRQHCQFHTVDHRLLLCRQGSPPDTWYVFHGP